MQFDGQVHSRREVIPNFEVDVGLVCLVPVQVSLVARPREATFEDASRRGDESWQQHAYFQDLATFCLRLKPVDADLVLQLHAQDDVRGDDILSSHFTT